MTKAMVKKRGTTAIAKRDQKKKLFHNPDTISDPKFRAVFDKEKSWIGNMNSVNMRELYNDSLPESIPNKASWTLPKLSEEELIAVKKLIASHGETGFRKMTFDRKLNVYQWTEEQCEAKVNLLLRDNRVHICEDGKCLCGVTPTSSYVAKKDRIRK